MLLALFTVSWRAVKNQEFYLGFNVLYLVVEGSENVITSMNCPRTINHNALRTEELYYLF
jgi:hypothetical protein